MTSSPNVPLRYINAAEVSDLNLLCHGNSVAFLSEQPRLACNGSNLFLSPDIDLVGAAQAGLFNGLAGCFAAAVPA